MSNFLKRVLLFLIILCSNIFAAIISDNDGVAFVTKSEFEALKDNFAEQIDNYNRSIDSKIDGAIASYLAGIRVSKTEAVTFPVAAGENVLICKSDSVTNLKFAKANLDLTFTVFDAQYNHSSANLNEGWGIIKFTRTGDSAYEIFNLNSEGKKFLFYDNQALLKLSGTWSFVDVNNHGGTANTTNAALRWHAHPWAKQSHNRANARVLDSGGRFAYFDDRFNQIGWCHFYGAFLNWGTGWRYSISGTSSYDVKTKVEIVNGNKVDYIFDNASTNSKCWVWDPTVNMDRVCSWPKGLYLTTNQQYNLPSTAGINVTGKILFRTNYEAHPSIINNPGWRDTYDYAGGINADSADDWYEFHLAPGENDEADTSKDYNNPSTIVNSNFDKTILDEYGTYGFHGYITEGLPIGIFNSAGKIAFTIDTTSLNTDTIIAIQNTPFTPSTQVIDNITMVPGIEKIKIDGVDKANCANKISKGQHEIEIDFSFENKTALFYKIAWPQDADTVVKSSRGILKLPEQYLFTPE